MRENYKAHHSIYPPSDESDCAKELKALRERVARLERDLQPIKLAHTRFA